MLLKNQVSEVFYLKGGSLTVVWLVIPDVFRVGSGSVSKKTVERFLVHERGLQTDSQDSQETILVGFQVHLTVGCISLAAKKVGVSDVKGEPIKIGMMDTINGDLGGVVSLMVSKSNIF